MRIVILLLTTMGLFSCDSGIYGSSQDDHSDTSEHQLQGKVIKAGLFRVIRSGGLVESKNTSTGKAISRPVIQLVEQTDRIPLVKDAHMSLQYRLWTFPDQPAYVELKRVLKHPPMTLPDGTVKTGSEYMIKGRVSVGQVIAYTGYGLNEDYEMLEGEWTFQIWSGEKKLVEQTFVTYWPDDEQVKLKVSLPVKNGAHDG